MQEGFGLSGTGFGTLSQMRGNVLELCVIPADVEGLESSVSSLRANGPTSQNRVNPMQFIKDGLLELIRVAKEADVKDATRAIARVKILSHLPCGYVGCTTPGTIHSSDVGKNNRAKGCSGCLKMRYCSSSCQKADWKAHKYGCKAIAIRWSSAKASHSNGNSKRRKSQRRNIMVDWVFT